LPASSAQTVNVSGPMLTAVPVVSMAGSLSAIGVNAAPVCVPVTTMSAAQEPSSCFVGATLVALNVRSGNEPTRLPIALEKPALSNSGRGRAWGPTNWSVAASATCSVVHVSALPAMGSPSKKMAMLSGGEATGSAGGAAVASVPSATVVTFAPSSVSSFVDSAAPSAIVSLLRWGFGGAEACCAQHFASCAVVLRGQRCGSLGALLPLGPDSAAPAHH